MDKALKTMIENMPEKTGKTLEQWQTILRKKAFEKHSEAVRFLKSEFNVTHGYANTIVALSKENDKSADDLVSAQYAGKENLLPVYQQLVMFVQTLGPDVTISPKKTSVSIIRKRQFALIKPASKTRIDLGLKLPNQPVVGKLGDSGPFGTMCTHRVMLGTIDDIDDNVKGWIKNAYEQSV